MPKTILIIWVALVFVSSVGNLVISIIRVRQQRDDRKNAKSPD